MIDPFFVHFSGQPIIIVQHNLCRKRSDYMLAMSKIEQLELEIKTKNEAFEMKEVAWKSKVG